MNQDDELKADRDEWKARALKAEQALDCATTGVCVRSGLYASPPSAVHVVEQLVEALEDAQRAFSPAIHVGVSSAIEAGKKFIKENGK